MHNETSGSASDYERQMDTAFRFMNLFGYTSVKTGYVGKIIPRGEHHDGQWMINHYLRVAEKAAQHQIMLDSHEPVRPTGLQRTWPNWMASEAARGNEYVTLYSPLQMVADLPENYEAHKDAFQFIKDVTTDWDDTKILGAEPGDYIYIARKEKNASRWFIGAITDENNRVADLKLSFLGKGTQGLATIYRDAPDADWKNNPEAYVIEQFIVDNESRLRIGLAKGGGAAVSLVPATETDLKKIKRYRNGFNKIL
jgi:hypothetical protein